jgi:predicted dehydrogenase
MKSANTIIEILGRPLRLGVIGGAPGSFIGEIHRTAARMDGRYELVCGVMSSDEEKAVRVGREMGFAEDRLYRTVDEMLEAEAGRTDGMDLVSIMTPHDGHFPYAMAALDRGFHVICDKPMTNTLDDARALYKKVEETGRIFCLTHNYTGYPLVRQARAMVAKGDLGEIRHVQIEYVQGGRAAEGNTSLLSRAWKYDKKRSGPSLVMGDIGTHAHNMIRFVTGLEVAALSARLGPIVPGREVDDYGGALLEMENGAVGMYWVTQAAAGVENSLKFRISGSRGSLEWLQEIPQRLTFLPLDGAPRILTPNGPETLPLSARSSRVVKGHPEGFPEAFANLYSDAAEAVASSIAGREADPLCLHFPNHRDGLKGVEFVYGAIESSRNKGAWVRLDS